eukprot:2063962-Prymnesium_polylepis.1
MTSSAAALRGPAAVGAAPHTYIDVCMRGVRCAATHTLGGRATRTVCMRAMMRWVAHGWPSDSS